KLSYYDLTGPHSRGTHYLTFPDGRFAYLSTGAKDFTPTHRLDDQFLMIVDLQDPANPKETGRWWLPGTRQGDAEPAPARVKPFAWWFPPAHAARRAGASRSRLSRVDRRRRRDPRYFRQVQAEARVARLVAVAERGLHAHRPADPRPGIARRVAGIHEGGLRRLADAHSRPRRRGRKAAVSALRAAAARQLRRALQGRRPFWRAIHQSEPHAAGVEGTEEHGGDGGIRRRPAHLLDQGSAPAGGDRAFRAESPGQQGRRDPDQRPHRGRE